MISNVRRYSIFLLAAFFVFYDIFIQISPGSLTHQLMQDLHIDASGLGMLSGIYFYTYLIMQIPAGLLYDRYPTRYVMFFPLLCTLVGALLFALSHTLLLASIARLLIGFGTAFAFISVAKVSADLFPKKYFPILIGTGYIFCLTRRRCCTDLLITVVTGTCVARFYARDLCCRRYFCLAHLGNGTLQSISSKFRSKV